MTRGPRIRVALAALCLVAVASVFGCSREEQPKKHTAADYQAMIDKAQADPQMPSNIKQMVLGTLRAQKAKAEKEAAGGR